MAILAAQIHNPIKQTATFADASRFAAPVEADFPELRLVGVKQRFGRNETVFTEGEEATFAYRLVKGAVRLCRYMADGRRQIAEFVRPGDFFGFLQFGSYGFSAEAIGDVEVIAYSQRHVERIAKATPELRHRLLVLLSHHLRDTQDHLLTLGRQTAKERVATFLLGFSERGNTGIDGAIDLPMSRQDIADYLGLTIETVCRVLSDLKRQRVIGIPDQHKIVLKDMDALRILIESDDEI